MAKIKKKKNRNLGTHPGAVVYTGDRHDKQVEINYVEYTQDSYYEKSGISPDELNVKASNESIVQWYDICGLHNIDVINKIGKEYTIHPIALEDALDVYQRPSYTEYSDAHFISLKYLRFDAMQNIVERQAMSIYFGKGYVLTFQEHEDDVFQAIRTRIENKVGRIRSRGADYLAYAIMDYVVDNYFQVLDGVEEKIEELEDLISTSTETINKSDLYALKKELLKIRKSVSPLREGINLFSRTESNLVDERTLVFIRDVYDHTIHIVDNTDTLRDILSGLQDLYISEISLRMNKIMQFLTIVTAIFVPLSFLTGLYGMNFEYIPELQIKNGYFILWGVMLLITLGSLFYFRKKKWL